MKRACRGAAALSDDGVMRWHVACLHGLRWSYVLLGVACREGVWVDQVNRRGFLMPKLRLQNHQYALQQDSMW